MIVIGFSIMIYSEHMEHAKKVANAAENKGTSKASSDKHYK
jgi:hypothetical protein